MRSYYTIKGALEILKEFLEEGYQGISEDLVVDCVNSDKYYISEEDAKSALEQYGIANAIEEVRAWEDEIFGESTIKDNEYEKIANMLQFIVAGNAFKLVTEGNNTISNEELIAKINKFI